MFRPAAHNLGRRGGVFHVGPNPPDQPSSSDCDEYGVERWNLFTQFDGNASLSNQNVPVVVGRDEDPARLERSVAGDRLGFQGLEACSNDASAVSFNSL